MKPFNEDEYLSKLLCAGLTVVFVCIAAPALALATWFCMWMLGLSF